MMNDQGLSTSTESDSTTEDEKADPIRQLKGETHRKFDKLSSQFTEMQKSQQQLNQLLQAALAPPPTKPRADDTDLDKMLYNDPKRFAAIIREQTKNELREELATVGSAQMKTQNTIAELHAEYPELGDKDAELTKKAVTILNSMDKEDRDRPVAYRFAVKQAAEELSMKPRSKREMEFDGPSNNPYGAPRRRERSPQKALEEMSPFAEAFGLDMSDPATQKRVIERSKRDSWGKFQEPLRTKKGKN